MLVTALVGRRSREDCLGLLTGDLEAVGEDDSCVCAGITEGLAVRLTGLLVGLVVPLCVLVTYSLRVPVVTLILALVLEPDPAWSGIGMLVEEE